MLGSAVGRFYTAFSRHSSRLFSVRSSISKKEFESRRKKFAEMVGRFRPSLHVTSSRHLVIVPAAEPQYSSLHVPYPFRQDSYFRYLTGLSDPNAVLVLEVSSMSSLPSKFGGTVIFIPRLFVEELSAHDELWDGPALGVDGAARITGIQDTMPLDLLPEYLRSTMIQLSAPSNFIWFSPPFTIRSEKKIPLNHTIFSLVMEKFSESQLIQSQLKNPNPLVDELRLIKSPSELSLMRQAVEVTSKVLKCAMASAYPGMREANLAARLEFESKLLGSNLGYPAVVAGGPRANIIHYLKNAESVEDGQLVLTDVGCEIEGYTADVSRTWPINGRFSREQRLLHDILIQVQTDCQRAANPDTSLEKLYILMLRQLSTYLCEENVLKLSENVSEQVCRYVCPHHVGHYLGLDVHDTASIPYSRKFEPGMVFPLEPGIYFPVDGRNLSVPKEFRGMGLRLEDDFVFTVDNKAEKLSDCLPVKTSEIETLVG